MFGSFLTEGGWLQTSEVKTTACHDKVGMLLSFGLACFGKRELEVSGLDKFGIRVWLSCETFKRNVKTLLDLLGTRSCARVFGLWIWLSLRK